MPESWRIYSSERHLYYFNSILISLNYNQIPGDCNSSVGIATRYGLEGPEIESRCGARFSALFQTSPGAHPASCTMGTGSFPGVKRPGRGDDNPTSSSSEVEGRVELYICSPSVPSWLVLGRFLPLPLQRNSPTVGFLWIFKTIYTRDI